MITKYGNIRDDLLHEYVNKRLVNKVFKLLPLKEEKSETLADYHESLMIELNGAGELINELQLNPDFMSLLFSLESLSGIEDMHTYRKKVFECISICKKLI